MKIIRNLIITHGTSSAQQFQSCNWLFKKKKVTVTIPHKQAGREKYSVAWRH